MHSTTDKRILEDRGGWYYRHHVAGRKRPWGGPKYLLARTQNRDLMTVLNEVIALVKANAPLAQGLEAAGRARRRKSRRIPWEAAPRYVGMAVAALLFVVLLAQWLSGGFAIAWEDVDALIMLLPFAILLALAIREWGFREAKTEALFLALRDRLQQGQQLSEAFASLPRIVPGTVVDLTAAGEQSGQLYPTLCEVRDRLMAKTRAREEITFTLLYGAWLIPQIAVIVAFLLIQSLPEFVEVQQEFETSPSERVVVLMHLGEWIERHELTNPVLWGFILPSIGLLIFLARRFSRWTFNLLERPLFYVPLVRRTLMQANLAPVCEVLAMLLKAGAPLPHALEQAEHMQIHPNVRHTLRRVRKQVEAGEPLSAAARAQGSRLPASFPAMIGLGEHSGMVPGALAHLADLYADNTRMRHHVLGQMLLPAIVLSAGAVVLFVLVSMYELVWGLSDAIFYSL